MPSIVRGHTIVIRKGCELEVPEVSPRSGSTGDWTNTPEESDVYIRRSEPNLLPFGSTRGVTLPTEG